MTWSTRCNHPHSLSMCSIPRYSQRVSPAESGGAESARDKSYAILQRPSRTCRLHSSAMARSMDGAIQYP